MCCTFYKMIGPKFCKILELRGKIKWPLML